ncbi:MAG: hypothetical protein KGR25_13825, partial [Chloroflexi bacterium]|nr:hypothetical protein [Chloroflexota bacterium]
LRAAPKADAGEDAETNQDERHDKPRGQRAWWLRSCGECGFKLGFNATLGASRARRDCIS